jgi:hypothetical protein
VNWNDPAKVDKYFFIWAMADFRAVGQWMFVELQANIVTVTCYKYSSLCKHYDGK